MGVLRGPMTNARVPKIAHNAKYDYIVLARHGLWVKPLAFDSMIAEFLVDPSSRNLGLKNLAFARLGEEMTHIEDLIGTRQASAQHGRGGHSTPRPRTPPPMPRPRCACCPSCSPNSSACTGSSSWTRWRHR